MADKYKFTFTAQSLKHGLAMMRLVKPSSGDFIVRFSSEKVVFHSSDKRRMSVINVIPDRVDVDDVNWVSDEYYIPVSKMSLFDSNLDTAVFTLTDNSIIIQASDCGQTKKATIKRRRTNFTRRNVIPDIKYGNLSLVDATKLDKILRVVGCSALVRETKTDEEMRINQVHFCSSPARAISNARFHASIVDLDDIQLDVSIIGSDIPIIRSFCAKTCGTIGLFQDAKNLFIVDAQTKSMIIFRHVIAAKVDFSPPIGEFNNEVVISRDKILGGLQWAIAALDGTQRLSCHASDGILKMSGNSGEIFSMPVTFRKGSSFQVDLPAKFLCTAINHTDSDDVILKLGHSQLPTIVEVSDEGTTCVRHYLQIMRGK